jgi:hypothetical protein
MRKHFASIVVVGLLLVCAVIRGGVWDKSQQAESLIDDLKRLDLSADPTSSFRAFKEKHHHQLAMDECRDNVCQYEFVVSNWVLSALIEGRFTSARAIRGGRGPWCPALQNKQNWGSPFSGSTGKISKLGQPPVVSFRCAQVGQR